MTSPSPFGPSQDSDLTKANWLGRYLDVESDAIKRLSEVLSDAADSIDESFSRLIKPANFSQQVRKSQLALVSSAIRSKVKQVFGDSSNIIRNGQQDAAVAAVNAQLYEQKSILSQMFGNQTDRDQFADSMRSTAKRNIDAVMTRVLETEQPLSQRVYHTQSIATGQVNQLINRALAKGDSAADLAKAVKDSIRPDVPGGVAYAAKRLARTELNNAFHAQSIHDMQAPWVDQVDWNLSKTHAEIGCLCEQYARIKVFPKDGVPSKPHPNCRCYVTPRNIDYDTFENGLIAGQYDSYIESLIPNAQRDDITGAYSVSRGSKKVEPQKISAIGEVTPEETVKVPETTGALTFGPARSTADQKKVATQQKRIEKAIPSTDVIGYDDPSLDPKAAKSVADALTRLAKKYPKAAEQIDAVGFSTDPRPNWSGKTDAAKEVSPKLSKTGGRRSTLLKISIEKSNDVAKEGGWIDDNAADVEAGFHPAISNKDPVGFTATHEFGHVIQFMFGGQYQITQTDAFNALGAAYGETTEIAEEAKSVEGFKDWIADSLTKYSFRATPYGKPQAGDLNVLEAIPEAFATVEFGGGNDAEKALHALLIDLYREHYG